MKETNRWGECREFSNGRCSPTAAIVKCGNGCRFLKDKDSDDESVTTYQHCNKAPCTWSCGTIQRDCSKRHSGLDILFCIFEARESCADQMT